MRRVWLTLCLALSMICALTACGSSKSVWVNCGSYECSIDYENSTLTIYKNNEDLAEISFTIEKESNRYYCEITFPDGSTYWEKQPTGGIKISSGMGTVITYSSAEGWESGCSEDYKEKNQLIRGGVLVDAIIQKYEEVQEGAQTFSIPVGKILLAIVIGFVGILHVCAPESMWFLNHGWMYKNVEPSEAGLASIRIMGVFVMVFAVIWLLVSCAG